METPPSPFTYEPEQFCGIALSTQADNIGAVLAQEIARVGHLELWQFQAFYNHDHPFNMPDLQVIEREAEELDAWTAYLHDRFPELRIVVEVRPFDVMTWFQAFRDAPTTDEEHFEDFIVSIPYQTIRKEDGTLDLQPRVKPARKGSIGPCEKCGAEDQFSTPELSPIHRGVKTMTCDVCHSELIHSTRTIRNLIEPA